jgi:hypothetical protein
VNAVMNLRDPLTAGSRYHLGDTSYFTGVQSMESRLRMNVLFICSLTLSVTQAL